MFVVVAKINFFDNIIEQEIKQYSSVYEAYVLEAYIDDLILGSEEEDSSIEEIKGRYFDADMMINILKMPLVR